MKNLTTKMMIAAAAFVAVAGTASAQAMEAKIPFAFRAGGTVLPAGTYVVKVDRAASGVPAIVIDSRELGKHAFALPIPNGNAKKAWVSAGHAVLSFQCGVDRCALQDIWTGDAYRPVYRIPVPSLGKNEPHSVAEIVMHPANGE